MDNTTTFYYSYSAKENQEILAIRKKYLPKCESKFEELKRLDNTVQMSGTVEALCAGIIGALVLGIGVCFAVQVIAFGTLFSALGIFIGLVGIAVMLTAYPIHRKIFIKTKQRLTPRILELTEDLSRNDSSTAYQNYI